MPSVIDENLVVHAHPDFWRRLRVAASASVLRWTQTAAFIPWEPEIVTVAVDPELIRYLRDEKLLHDTKFRNSTTNREIQ